MKKRRRSIGHYNNLNKNRSLEDQSIYSEFGRRLEARMNQLGWSQSELSRRATACLPKAAVGQVQGHSLGRDRISSYVRGKYLPRPPALEALAKALKCESEDLLSPENIPSVVPAGPRFEMKSIDSKNVRIRIDRIVSQKTATAIMVLLNKEDGL
jgi:transcriptional regulator with XRE-family HTH domain